MPPRRNNRKQVQSSDSDDDYTPLDINGNPMPTVSTEGWDDLKTVETKSRRARHGNMKRNNREQNVKNKGKNATSTRHNDTDSESEEDIQAKSGFTSKGVELTDRGRGQLPLLTAFEASEISYTGARKTGGGKTIRTVFARETPEEIEELKRQNREPLPQYSSRLFGLGEGVRRNMPISPNFQRIPVGIPIRPPWKKGMSAKALHAQEEKYFLQYLTNIYSKYGSERLNHFEHNLDVWRQLWRVCERSDVLVMVADARHPLLHFHAGMYQYVKSLGKPFVLVLNKVDTLPLATIQDWKTYFNKMYPDMHVVVFSSYPSLAHRVAIEHGFENVDDSKQTEEADLTELLGGLDLTPADLSEHAKEVGKRKRAPRIDCVGVDGLLAACRQAVDKVLGVSPDVGVVDFNSQRLLTDHDREMMERKRQERERDMENLKNQLSKLQSLSADGSTSSYVMEEEDGGADVEHAGDEKALKDLSMAVNSGKAKSVNITDLSTNKDAKSWREGRKGDESLRRLQADLARINKNSDDDDDDDYEIDMPNKYKPTRPNMKNSKKKTEDVKRLTVGMIGHPNAGKSSVVNALTGKKLVSVSRQPGHTKIFQTLLINEHTVLCDCPGLIFPNVDIPRPMQVLTGIYPIPQTREPVAAVRILAQCVPLDSILGLPIRDKSETPYSALDICDAYALKRGFVFAQNRPDSNRAAQAILYGCADGRLQFYFEPPTDTDPSTADKPVVHCIYYDDEEYDEDEDEDDDEDEE